MKRDMELIRSILLRYEQSDEYMVGMRVLSDLGNADVISGHIQILEDAGFIEPHVARGGDGLADMHLGWHVTWNGHEFIDKVRDPEIWRKTRDGAGKLGSWSVKLLGDMATGYIRVKAAELGLPGLG